MRSFMAGENTQMSVRRALIFTALAMRATGFGSTARGAAWATTGVNAAVITRLARPAIKRLDLMSNSLPGKPPRPHRKSSFAMHVLRADRSGRVATSRLSDYLPVGRSRRRESGRSDTNHHTNGVPPERKSTMHKPPSGQNSPKDKPDDGGSERQRVRVRRRHPGPVVGHGRLRTHQSRAHGDSHGGGPHRMASQRRRGVRPL